MAIYDFVNIISLLPAGYLLFLVTQRFLDLRTGKVPFVVLLLMDVFVMGTIVYVGDPVNILGVMPIFAAGIWFCCTGSKLARLSTFLILFPLVMSVNAIIDSFIVFNYNNVLRLIFWVIAWQVINKTMPKGDYSLPAQLWYLVDILALLPFIATMSAMFFGDYSYAFSKSNIWAMGVLPFAAISAIGLMGTVVVLTRHQKLEQEQNLWQLRNIYYQNLEQSQIQVRRLRHDMANHLQILAGLEGPAADSYLEELIDSPAIQGERRYCENQIANTVLAVKYTQLEEDGITSELEVKLPKELPISDIDLCALLANSLDNAIEACRKVPLDKRYIRVSALAEKGVFLLQIENSRAGEINTKKGKLITTKNDAENHGYGLASTQEMVGRYNGRVTIEYDKNKFCLLVSIPLL